MDSAVLLISGIATAIVLILILRLCSARQRLLHRLIRLQRSGDYLAIDDSADWIIPEEHLNDEELLLQLAIEYGDLSPQEQQVNEEAALFTKQHPPLLTHVRGASFLREDEHLIRDFGIGAFHFDQDTRLEPRYVVADKTELNFINNDSPYSTATSILNYPFPLKNRVVSNTVYYETKVFEYENTANSHFAIGLVTRPYPVDLRLPGYNLFSISYESTGNLKINKPFPTPSQQHRGEQSQYNAFVLPPLQQSDIVGFGYVVSTGTIFITRNGKKLMDVVTGCYCDMYPAVGCFLTNAKFHVNLGQLGYVWIEANVRKYGFVAASEYKRIAGDLGVAALPQYVRATDSDKTLDKGEDLPPRYPTEELDFFGRSLKEVKFGSSSKEREESSTHITHETEEEMDFRSRVYEGEVLLKKERDLGYGATGESSAQVDDDSWAQGIELEGPLDETITPTESPDEVIEVNEPSSVGTLVEPSVAKPSLVEEGEIESQEVQTSPEAESTPVESEVSPESSQVEIETPQEVEAESLPPIETADASEIAPVLTESSPEVESPGPETPQTAAQALALSRTLQNKKKKKKAAKKKSRR